MIDNMCMVQCVYDGVSDFGEIESQNECGGGGGGGADERKLATTQDDKINCAISVDRN